MKLRQVPDDFVVEEVPSREWSESGKFAVYKVSKVGMTTFAAEKVLAGHCNASFKRIGFAGLKDAHARTVQYFSVEADDSKCGNFKERNVSSELVGFLDSPLRTGDLKGNRFVITVRDLKNVDLSRVGQVKLGVPNYFDSQRFGSLKGVSGFIAKDVLTGDYESAVKKIITATTRHQKAKVRGVRKFIGANWGEWSLCLDEVRKAQLEKSVEGTVIRHLAETSDFKGAFQKTFRGIRQIFFNAYLSFIWNECVKRVVRQNSREVFGIDYEAGRLVFPRSWNPEAKLSTFPTVSADLKTSEEYMKIVLEVLAQENMKLSDFKSDEHIFISREREIVLVPENLEVSSAEVDELNEYRKKVVVSFSLPKGAYATIILKALFQ